MRRQLSAPRSFNSDKRGSVALIFALCSTAILIIVGLAVDGARAYNLASRVGAALDAAALAGASMLNKTSATDTEVQAAVQATLNAELRQLGVSGVTFAAPSISLDRANSAVTVTANVTVQTIFGAFAGAPTIAFNKSATTNYQLAKLEVVLALDITGSMNQIPVGDTVSKLTTLKAVATDVVTSLYNQAVTESNIRIGIVPWSNSVNVGSYASQVATLQQQQQDQQTADCVTERTGGADVTDDAPAPINYAGTLPSGSSCPSDVIVPLVGKSQLSALTGMISGLTATSGTAGHIGTAWAWYMISPNWTIWPSGSTPDSYSSPTVKNVIVLTDGIFNTDYVGGTRTGAYDTTSYTLFQQNCQGMRAAGINVYTIAFDLTDTTAVSNLQQCVASGNYYSATNAATLSAAFDAIIKKLTVVRVSK